MSSRWLSADVARGAEYDERWAELKRRGQSIHGEANFVSVFQPRTALDAGCGTGRVSIELARRGVQTLGVDLDESMLRTAVDKAPELRWCLGDLSVAQILDEAGEVELFDVILAAGNVMIFLEPGTEQSTVYRLADHLVGGGVLIAGFQLGPSGLTVLRYDELCRRAGLELTERYSTWARDPFGPSSRYAVSVHRRPRY